MSQADKEGVLSRWSRLKLESTHTNSDTAAAEESTTEDQEIVSAEVDEIDPTDQAHDPLADLPSIDELGPDSDFRGFMDPRVEDSLRRSALKKLFRDPDFNVADGLDVYAEDYTKLESMTPAMVAGLKHSKRLLFGEDDADKKSNTAGSPDALEEQPVSRIEQTGSVQEEAHAVHSEDQHPHDDATVDEEDVVRRGGKTGSDETGKDSEASAGEEGSVAATSAVAKDQAQGQKTNGRQNQTKDDQTL